MSDLKFGDPKSIQERDSARRWSEPGRMTANKPTSSSWRNHSRDVIRATIATHKGEDHGAVRAAIKASYPFGQRKYTPYKIWLEEIRLQCEFYGIGK